MAHISGVTGSVSAPAVATGIKSWSCDYTVDMLETTDFASAGIRSYVAGPSGWAGSFEGWKDGAPLTLSTIPLALKLNESATSTWTGDAFITGVHPNISFDGIVTYSYDFQGTGALTAAT